jgi:hypothetical protein
MSHEVGLIGAVPIPGGVYIRKDVEFRLAEDYSTVTITRVGQTVTIEGNAVADLLHVMWSNVRAGDEELSGRRLWNIALTSLSCRVRDPR